MPKLVYEEWIVDLDEHVQNVVDIHARETPFWLEYQQRNNFDLIGEIECFDDLRKLPYFTDEDLRAVPPESLVPSSFPPGKMVLSVSSGTTGEPKKVYWSRDVVDTMVRYAHCALKEDDFPYGGLWACTGPRNEMFRYFLKGLCGTFMGEMEYVEVDAAAIKRAFGSGDPALMKAFFDDVLGRVGKLAENGMSVYEDIAPLMAEAADRLPENKRNGVRGLLLGGVATTLDKIDFFRSRFPNAKVGGWYGDFMNGTGMMRKVDESGLAYQPFFPYAVWEVRDLDDFERSAAYGGRGEVLSHRLGMDLFLPNRRVGDEAERARPVEPFQWDGVKNVTRLSRPRGP